MGSVLRLNENCLSSIYLRKATTHFLFTINLGNFTYNMRWKWIIKKKPLKGNWLLKITRATKIQLAAEIKMKIFLVKKLARTHNECVKTTSKSNYANYCSMKSFFKSFHMCVTTYENQWKKQRERESFAGSKPLSTSECGCFFSRLFSRSFRHT